MTSPERRPDTTGRGRFVILGAGAVGSHLAHALHHCRENRIRITIADVDVAVRDAWAARGVPVMEPAFELAAFAWQETDIVVLATKATAAASALASVPRRVPVIVVSNGIIEAADLGLRRSLGWGVVDFAASAEAPGRSVCTHPGRLTLGAYGAGDAPQRLAGAFAGSPIQARLISNIDGYRWSKLIFNASFCPIATLTGQTYGHVFAHRPSRRALRRLLSEGVAIARAAGIDLVRVHGNLPSTLARVLGVPLLSEIAGQIGSREARSIESVMLDDLRRGMPTEVDFLNGHIVRTAQRLGVPAPAHCRMVQLIHDLERSGKAPGLDRAAELLAPGRRIWGYRRACAISASRPPISSTQRPRSSSPSSNPTRGR
ncbi:MAG: ketopantoate reductase family protein [Hyphomicrobiales bacterium]